MFLLHEALSIRAATASRRIGDRRKWSLSFCYPEETSGLGHREHSWLSLGEHVTMMRSPLPETLFPFGKCPQQQLLPKSMPAELQTLGKPPNKVSLHAPLFHGGPLLPMETPLFSIWSTFALENLFQQGFFTTETSLFNENSLFFQRGLINKTPKKTR